MNIFDISLSTLFIIINRVAELLCSISRHIITWPSNEDIESTKAFFDHHKSFPNVVGLIDGSHIFIDKPVFIYINRKNQYSFQMQGVVNERKKFVDIYIGYPGSVHDARVYRSSILYPLLEDRCQGGYILGDSAYPLKRSRLTPYRDNGHLTPIQQLYNDKHSSARIGEHAFSILKQRFRYLYHVKFRNMKLIVLFIKACVVLHNLASDDDSIYIEENEIVANVENLEYDLGEPYENAEGRERRDAVANETWARQ